MEPKANDVEETLLSAFGSFVRRRRRMTEQTQEIISDKCPNISRATLARWENGLVSQRISDEQISELAVALEIEPEIVRFRYQRSLDLAEKSNQEVPVMADFYATQRGFDDVIAEQGLVPVNDFESEAWELVQKSLKNYYAIKNGRAKLQSSERF